MLKLQLYFSRLDRFIARRVNYTDNLQVLIWYEIFGAIGYSAVPGSHGIRNFGEARGMERTAVNGVDRQRHFDSHATFFAMYWTRDCCGI